MSQGEHQAAYSKLAHRLQQLQEFATQLQGATSQVSHLAEDMGMRDLTGQVASIKASLSVSRSRRPLHVKG